MPSWAVALLVGAAGVALAIGAKVGAWWRGRTARRELVEAIVRADRAELERDVAAGEASVAKANVEVLAVHVDRQEAAHEVAEELRDAAPASLDPDARRAALRASVRAHANGDGPRPVSGGGDAAGVRPQAAARPARDDDAR